MYPRRILLAKTGLDCHDTGIVTVAQTLLEAMSAARLSIPVICGGVIPGEDAAQLKAMGVAAVIPPGTLTKELLGIVGGALTAADAASNA